MSSLNSIRFTCTALNGMNKSGNLVCDADGYYTTVIGGLNVYNSVGQMYTANGVKELFESSGLLMRRVQRGRLHGEYGHPKPLPGERERDFLNRMFLINEEKMSHHFKEIWLDENSVKDHSGNPVIAIMAKVRPSGPYGKYLEDALKNPAENVCFSIRAFTDDFRERGITYRQLKTIITWDYVQSPGIAFAEKFSSPALEGLQVFELEDRVVTRGQIERAFGAPMVKTESGLLVAQESAKMNIDELMYSMGWSVETRPAFRKW